jgi:hypothetical protein
MIMIKGGYSAFSSGPIFDTTPHDDSCHVTISDTGIQNTPFGPPYQISAVDSAFTRLKNKLAKQKGVTNPAGLAAKIGREQIGQAEMTRRSVEARKDD